mmetsp:Transcript_19475/g.26419  ORF Transcript_19475/g.26419 Transcript_19475/m.26419 type:complete len:151 (-) Transcript_19475:60-512(-)
MPKTVLRRMHFFIWIYDSVSVSRYALSSGAVACWSPWFLGRDPEAWGGDAAEFRPDRCVRDPLQGGAASRFSWLPFGAGPRGCLGTRLGVSEGVIGVARLLSDFDFEFERQGSPLPVRYDLTLNLDNVAFCRVSPREPVPVPDGLSGGDA